MSIRIQTVEDHILARAVIVLCNRMGTRLNSEFGFSRKRMIDTAYRIAQERGTEPIFDGSKFVLGAELVNASSRVADAYDKAVSPTSQ